MQKSAAGLFKLITNLWDEGKIFTQQNEFGNPAGWKIEIVKNIGRDLLRWLWIQIILPLKIKRDDVLFSTFSESPVRCKCKTVLVVHDLMPVKFPEKHSKKLNYSFIHSNSLIVF